MPLPTIEPTTGYAETRNSVVWQGLIVTDASKFSEFLREVVSERIREAESKTQSVLSGLATTGMATEFVEQLLRATPEPLDWEIGEALAECSCHVFCGCEVVWPWNSRWDRRTPKASLPGADLVGFHINAGVVSLLIGEVKTSSENKSPPNVMCGRGGMAWQLDQSASSKAIQSTLLQWLLPRCKEEPFDAMYRAAAARFLNSFGKDFVLAGVLVRDTQPNVLDLQSRGRHLSDTVHGQTRVLLTAIYLPLKISTWPAVMRGPAV